MYVFKNTKEENRQIFIDRTWYIVKNIDKYEDYEYLEKLSYIWVSQKYYDVIYSNYSNIS